MPRLKPLPPATTPELKPHFDFFLGTLGFTPNSVLTMQRKPKLVQALLGAHNFGISDAKLADVWTYGSSPHYSVRERLALDFALAAASQPNAVTDAQFAELQQHWSDGEITEILGVVAMFAFLNRWNDTMGTPLEAPATDVADKAIGARGWTSGKHSDL